MKRIYKLELEESEHDDICYLLGVIKAHAEGMAPSEFRDKLLKKQQNVSNAISKSYSELAFEDHEKMENLS